MDCKLRNHEMPHIWHQKVVEITTLILLFVLCFSGCMTSSVRYTRASHREKHKEEKKKVENKSKDKKVKTENKSKPYIAPPHKESIAKTKTRSTQGEYEKKLRNIVSSYLGVRYRYGGTSRRGMDCSGFVWRVFNDLGKKDFPRTASAHLTKLGSPVLRKNAQIGDLVFFRNRRRINHVGIYMGNKKFVHASSRRGVTYTSINNDYFRKRFVCLRRVY